MDAPGTERDLEFRPLFNEEIRVAVPAGHRWQDQKAITAAELVKEPLLSYTASSYLSQIIRTHIEREGLRMPPPVIELGSLEAIKEMVILGMGVALIPAWVGSAEVANGSLVMVPLTGKKLSRKWGIAYRKGRRLSHGEETFVKLCARRGLEMTGKE
jgi:DNA-binding transcriptional LysR family regulator